MDTKLTLRLEKEIIEQIKIYALRHQLSVSALTEDLYKNILIDKKKDSNNIFSPIAKKYKGILGKTDIDIDKLRFKYLKDKHLR